MSDIQQNTMMKNQENFENREQFYKLMKKIKNKNKIDQCMQTIDDIYGLRHYNIMKETPRKITLAYQSICQRIYAGICTSHKNIWIGYELKVFIWLIVCDLFTQIKDLSQIPNSTWEKYQRIFHGKSIQLMQYQVKLITCSKSNNRKWQKQEDYLLLQIMKSTGINSQWNDIARRFYFQSNKIFFRNPKQIREHYINHLDPDKTKQKWSLEEDYDLMLLVQINGKKWAKIAKINGSKRTEHMIKNRYNTLIRAQQRLLSGRTMDQKILAKRLINKLREELSKAKNSSQSQWQKQISREGLSKQKQSTSNNSSYKLQGQLSLQQQGNDIVISQNYLKNQDEKQKSTKQYFEEEFQNWLLSIRMPDRIPQMVIIQNGIDNQQQSPIQDNFID